MTSYAISVSQFCFVQLILFCIPILVLQLLLELFYVGISRHKLPEKFQRIILFFTFPGSFIYEFFVVISMIALGCQIKRLKPQFDWHNGYRVTKDYSFTVNNFMNKVLHISTNIVPVLAVWLLVTFIFSFIAQKSLNDLSLSSMPATLNISTMYETLSDIFKGALRLPYDLFKTKVFLSPIFIIGCILSSSILLGPIVNNSGIIMLKKDIKTFLLLFVFFVTLMFICTSVCMVDKRIWQYVYKTTFTIEYSIIILAMNFNFLFFILLCGVNIIRKNQTSMTTTTRNIEKNIQPKENKNTVTTQRPTAEDQNTKVTYSFVGSTKTTLQNTPSIPLKTNSAQLNISKKQNQLHEKKFNKEDAEKILQTINEDFIGLKRVKAFFLELYTRQMGCFLRNEEYTGFNNCFFIGNPGTGKTSIARLLGQFYFALGITSEPNKLKEVDPIADFTSKWQSEYTEKIRNIFDEANGGVLFIDEAYQFAKDEQGRKVLDQMVKLLTEEKYKNMVVVMAGYTEDMQHLYEVNPGLKRRFPHEVYFDNFSTDELKKIFYNLLRNDKQLIDESEIEQFDNILTETLKKISSSRDFGNASSVVTFYNDIVKYNQTVRIVQQHTTDKFRLYPDDLLKKTNTPKETINDILAELDREFIGLDSLKQQIRDFSQSIAYEKLRAKTLKTTTSQMLPCEYNLRFVGNPGTGKTTIARYMARIFFSLGIIDNTIVKEYRGVDLKASYTGQTKDRVNAIFEENPGRVVIIDEIYSLYDSRTTNHDAFAIEAIDALVGAITDTRNSSVLLVIAGYKDRMDEFLTSNPGLARRFNKEIFFPDYSDSECRQILFRLLDKEQYIYPDSKEFFEKVESLFAVLKNKLGSNWGNAGTVKSVFDTIKTNISNRVLQIANPTEYDFRMVMLSDIPEV